MTVEDRLKDICENPKNHRHEDLNDLNRCRFVDGAIHLGLLQAHEGIFGVNGGVG